MKKIIIFAEDISLSPKAIEELLCITEIIEVVEVSESDIRALHKGFYKEDIRVVEYSNLEAPKERFLEQTEVLSKHGSIAVDKPFVIEAPLKIETAPYVINKGTHKRPYKYHR